MATRGLKSLTSMSPRLTGGAPEESDIAVAERVLKPQADINKTYLSQTKEAGERVAKSQSELEKARMEQKSTMLEAGAQAEREYADKAKALTGEAEKKVESFPFPEFRPTQEDATSIAQLASLVGTMGVMLGAGGKASAKVAIGAMTGMMNGWQKGRKDLWEREAKTFEKEMQRIKSLHESIYKNLESGLKQASRNREAAKQEYEAAKFKAGSNSIIAAMLENGQTEKAFNLVKETNRNLIDFENKKLNLAIEERNRRDREEYQRKVLDLQRRQIEATKAAAEAKAEKKGEASKNSIGLVAERKIEAKAALLKQYDNLIEDYKTNKDKYQLSPNLRTVLAAIPFGASLSETLMSIARSNPQKFPNATELSQFIGKLESVIAPDRHALYGANLTKNELPRYERTIPKITDDPEVFLKFLESNRKNVEESLRSSQSFYANRGVDLKLNEIYDKSQPFIETKSGTPKFNTLKEAEDANLPVGTKIMVGDKPATVE